jgi:hypothetical protein
LRERSRLADYSLALASLALASLALASLALASLARSLTTSFLPPSLPLSLLLRRYAAGITDALKERIPKLIPVETSSISSSLLVRGAAFVALTGALYWMTFASVQALAVRRRGTLRQTKNFGLVVVLLVSSILSTLPSVSAFFYSVMERRVLGMLGRGFSAQAVFAAAAIGRSTSMLETMAYAIAVAVLLFIGLMRNHSEVSPSGLGRTVLGEPPASKFGAPLEAPKGKGGKSKSERGLGSAGKPPKPAERATSAPTPGGDRQAMLAEKLRQRKLKASGV